MNHLKHSIIFLLSFIGFTAFSQSDCIELLCDDGIFLSQQIQNVNIEITEFNNTAFPPGSEVGFSNDGIIEQCFFQGQPVYSFFMSPFIPDLPRDVVDCSGNLLFSFGSNIPGGTPGDDLATQLEGCITLFTIDETDNAFCTSAQLDCTEQICTVFDEIVTNLLDPNFNPSDPISGCTPSQTLSQCDYRGQIVIVQSPGFCGIADEPSIVSDCTGDFLFSFGGFCFTQDGSPCPGDIEAQFISNCEVIFSVQQGDPIVCDEVVIPTLGEWALISLSILFLIFGIVLIRERQLTFMSSVH